MKLTKVNFKKCDTTISKVSSAKQKRDKQVNVVRQVISKFQDFTKKNFQTLQTSMKRKISKVP